MDGDGNAKDDVKVPDSDLGKEIQDAFEGGKDLMVTIVAAMGELLRIHSKFKRISADIVDEEQAISWKEAPAEK